MSAISKTQRNHKTHLFKPYLTSEANQIAFLNEEKTKKKSCTAAQNYSAQGGQRNSVGKELKRWRDGGIRSRCTLKYGAGAPACMLSLLRHALTSSVRTENQYQPQPATLWLSRAGNGAHGTGSGSRWP